MWPQITVTWVTLNADDAFNNQTSSESSSKEDC